MNYTKEQESHLLKRAEKYRTIDEIRKMNTLQGKFEHSFQHYDAFSDIDPDQNKFLQTPSLALSPAQATQLKLDFLYFAHLFRRTNHTLYRVFIGVFYGYTWRALGMPKRSWWNYFEKIENILAREG